MKLKAEDVSLLGGVFSQLDKMLIVLNDKLHIQYINSYAKEIIKSNVPVVGMTIQEILLESNIAFQLDTHEKIVFIKPIKIKNAIKKLKTHTGTVDGKPTYFILDEDVTEQETTIELLEKSMHDITGQIYLERVSPKQYLDETVGFLRKIIKQMPCYVYWKDKEFRYLYCNDLTVQLMGFKSVEEVKGKSDYDFGWEPSLVEAFRETDIKILKTGVPVRNLTEDLIDKNGRTYHTLVNKLPIKNEAGLVIGILGITVDITEIQDMQIALQKAKVEAEAASIAKTKFIANMSHDIRTPLTGVIGLSQILKETLKDVNNKEKARMLHESGEELLYMLNEILDDVRAGNLQETDVKNESFDVHQCIHDLIRLESPATEVKQLALKTNIASNVPQYIESDRNKIHRILLNLAGNAIKFTQCGSITLGIECLHIDSDKVHLKFSVTDTGIGIPDDLQHQVFNRFFKVSSSYEGIHNGHGLGLHIAQTYAGLLGGKITLTSKEGVGSTFYFDLECALGEAPNETTEENALPIPSSTPSKSYHLLLVEDNFIALKSLELLLTQKNYTLLSATTGEEAQSLLNHHPFDLMITDIGLPGISGTALTKWVREQEKLQNKPHLPIIGLTGHARDATLQECTESGMDEVLSKPAQIDIIHACIQQLMQGEPLKSSLGEDLPDREEALFQLEQFPIFDEALALKQCPDRQLLMKLLESSITQPMQQDITLLKEAHKQQNWEEIEKIAHKIKGGMAYLGTQKMRYACQYFERYYKNGHKKLFEPLYQQIISVNDETCAVLRVWLQNNK